MSSSEVPVCREVWLVIISIQKDKNIGSLLRTAVAFGATGVCVCGGITARISTLGAKGAERGARIEVFPGRQGLSACKIWLQARGIRLVGLEIDIRAVSVCDHARAWGGGEASDEIKGVAVMPGNEALGLSDAQKTLCDGFAYIPQYGRGGTASLNVAAATAIALHHASTWANLSETQRDSEGRDKFKVTIIPTWTGERDEKQAAVAKARAESILSSAQETEEAFAFGTRTFSHEEEDEVEEEEGEKEAVF